MNNKNNSNNINYIEINGNRFISQEELKNLDNQQCFLSCKCGKKPEFRWKKSEQSDSYGLFYGITPFRGKNGEEVCHKCAPCAKCGKEGYYPTGRVSYCNHVKTNDNPSGEWAQAYCSEECFNGTEKPSLPEKEPRQVENCNYCGKLTAVKFGNSPTEKTFCSRDCYVAAGNKIQKGKCRIASCSKEDYYECMDLCLGHSKPCQGTYMGKKCNLALGSDEGNFCKRCKNQDTEKDKWNFEEGDFIEIEKYEQSPKSKFKTIKFENNLLKPTENSPVKTDNQTLIINLKSIKQITLTSDNNLVIEFNKTETNSVSQEVEIVNDKQISSSQELQKIKNYLQGSGEKSINQQNLNSILSSDNTNTGITDEPDNYALAVGLSVIFVLSGLTIGLLIRRKLKAVRK